MSSDFKIIGFEQSLVKVIKINEDSLNDAGKILYFPSNEGYAVVLRTTASELPSPITGVMSTDNEINLSEYSLMGNSRPQYVCQWLFYHDGKDLLPGVPVNLPKLHDSAVELTSKDFDRPMPDFSGMYQLYNDVMTENGIADKHLTFLMTLKAGKDKFVYEFIVQTLLKAVREKNQNVIALIDNLLRDDKIYESVSAELAKSQFAGTVVAVEDGLINTANYAMPGVGDLYKFKADENWIYSTVYGVRYRFENFEIGQRTLELLRKRVLTKSVTYKPLVSLPIGSTKPIPMVREFPDFGTIAEPIEGDDVDLMYPGKAILGNFGKYQIHFDVKTLQERSVGSFGKSGSGKSTMAQLVGLQMVEEGETILVFDEHQEFAKTHQAIGTIKWGLQDLFPERVRTVAFGTVAFNTPDGAQHQADASIKIPISLITEDDLLQVGDALGLTRAAPKAISTIARLLKDEWHGQYQGIVDAILFTKPAHYDYLIHGGSEEDEQGNVVVDNSAFRVNERSFEALRSSLARIFLARNNQFKEYYTTQPAKEIKGSLMQVVDWLKGGQSVIINAKTQSGSVLIVNVLFRIIVTEWQKKKPRHLTIFIEEAHRLIPRNNDTIVSMVAREMRKYDATLFIIDQTPKKLDQEVVKQLGTYFLFPSDYEEASCVLPEGTPVSDIMSRLAAVREAYVYGSAFLLPTFIKVADYYEIGEAIRQKHLKPVSELPGIAGGNNSTPSDSGSKMFSSKKPAL